MNSFERSQTIGLQPAGESGMNRTCARRLTAGDSRMNRLLIIGLILLAVTSHLSALDPSITQLAVSVGSDWNATSGKLQLFERDGREWRAASAPFRVLYGKSGLAWGRGLLGVNEPGPQKTERDKRAPAGVFKIGKIYTYDPAFPGVRNIPFTQLRRPMLGLMTPRCHTTTNTW